VAYRSRALWAEVDLSALRHNISVLKRTVYPAQLAVVVKANGYGHGATQIARQASELGVSFFCVATVEEGIELKDADIKGEVIVLMEPEREYIEEALAKDLTLTIYNARTLVEVVASWQRLARGSKSTSSPKIHIKVDTGMHRLGVSEEEALELARLARDSGVSVGGLSSHLAVADAGELGRGYTLEQIARFERVVARLATINIRPSLLHLANTAGGVAYPSARYDLVRSGIGVYGYLPSQEINLVGLRPVMSLKSRVSFVRRLKAGEAVSYGLRRPLASASFIATVPIGYADGLRRTLFDRGQEVLIKGERVPIAGTVTMDQIMIDCGDVEVAQGEEVVLLGRQGANVVTALEWAEALETIPYEVLTSIAARVPRIYIDGSDKGADPYRVDL
jgi:alanine racemase